MRRRLPLFKKQTIMRKLLIAIALLSTLTLQAKKWTADEVKDVIRKVNTYWQTNNPAEVRSFWDNAAYHTGNMETYKLLKDEKMLDYSIRWAEHNQWKGATEADPPSGSTKITAKDRNTFSSATGKSVSRRILTSTISQKTRKR